MCKSILCYHFSIMATSGGVEGKVQRYHVQDAGQERTMDSYWFRVAHDLVQKSLDGLARLWTGFDIYACSALAPIKSYLRHNF